MSDTSIAGSSPPKVTAAPRQLQLADESAFQLHALSGNGTTIKVLPNGCIYSIECGDILVNQVLGSPVAGGIHRIYLRIRANARYSFVEIVGPGAAGKFTATVDRLVWTGAWEGLDYRCICWIPPGGDNWVFQVQVENRSPKPVDCDAVMVQDIGLAARNQSRNNERFTSQYLDHFAANHAEIGYVLMSRQNLPQEEARHPWLLQGCFPKAKGFSTDGFDFFGIKSKGDAVPQAISLDVIGQQVRQYEAGFTALQGMNAEIAPAGRQTWSFFSNFLADHPEPSSPADIDDKVLKNLRICCEKMAATTPETKTSAEPKQPRGIFQTANLLKAMDFDEADIRGHFPGQLRHEEFDGPVRSSFFIGPESRHVVLKAKELAVSRPHGHIMRCGRGLLPSAEVMSCTCYAAGVFASQLALGNTVFGKILSTARDPLNIVRSSGLRIFVRRRPSDAWELLGVPSAFEMSPNVCRWLYKSDADLLAVTCSASNDDPVISYAVHSEKHAVELLICGEISAGPQEYDSNPRLSIDGRRSRITIRPDPRSPLGEAQPDILVRAVTSTPEAIDVIGGDELLGPANRSQALPYFAIRTRPTHSFSLCFIGTIESIDRAEALCAKYEAIGGESSSQAPKLDKFWKDMTAGVRVSSASSNKAAQIQDALVWFAQDAIIHFGVPRGLEQANGGAWGVRDVCQGPVEFLLSYDHAEIVKTIVLELFSRQFCRRCDWPQWFMFPPFQECQSSTCHGDILIWPVKALCDYLEQTNDGEILRRRVPYTDDETFQCGERPETILEHVDRVLEKMRRQFLPGTSLPRYGEGDWDDSLQPVCPHLGNRMASSWTVALMYQTLRRYGVALAHFGQEERANAVRAMAQRIHTDFQRYLMPDGVVAGFGVFDPEPTRPAYYLLHPSDTQTGIRYRLIPMTRGILSGIFSTEQAKQHLELVKKHLLFPDGARLMDRPTKYDGGRESVFRRSESAAFFGREIGLQYVHAHLRYAEALAAMGHSKELLNALGMVNPIAVTEVVKNALPRQRNTYFSSSDAAFRDRYEASRDYEKLRRGEVAVEGGWRIYSSGPGIFTNLVIRHLFGLRRYFDYMEFDPVLPPELNEIHCDLSQNGRRVRYQFAVNGEGGPAQRVVVNGVELPAQSRADCRYRPGGLRIRKTEFQAALTLPENVVRIEM